MGRMQHKGASCRLVALLELCLVVAGVYLQQAATAVPPLSWTLLLLLLLAMERAGVYYYQGAMGQAWAAWQCLVGL
jgi:hypothetical protein